MGIIITLFYIAMCFIWYRLGKASGKLEASNVQLRALSVYLDESKDSEGNVKGDPHDVLFGLLKLTIDYEKQKELAKRFDPEKIKERLTYGTERGINQT